MTTTRPRGGHLHAAILTLALAAGSGVYAQPQAERPERILQSAHGLLGKGLYELAAEEYRRYLEAAGTGDEIAADRITAVYGLAVSLHRQGDPAGALRAIGNTAPPHTHPFAAEIALLKGACAYELSEFDEATETLDRFLAAHAEHASAPRAALMLIESLGALGETREQQRAAAAFLALWPEDAAVPRVTLLSGIALSALGRDAEAAEAYGSLIRSDTPEAAPAALRLARLDEAAGNDRADELYRIAATGDRETAAHARLALARRLRESGDARGAIDALNAWLDDPADAGLVANARLELGRAYLDAGLAQRAIGQLEQADEELDAPDARYWLARALRATGDLSDAITAFDAIASDAPEHALAPYALFDLGAALRESGEPRLASEIFAKLRRLHSQHELAANALYAEAAIALDSGETDSAVRLASRFVTDYPSHGLGPDAALLLADAQYFSERYRDAAQTLRELMREAPGYEPSYTAFRLGMALQHAGDSDDSAKALATAATNADDDERLRPAVLAMADLAYERGDWRGAVEYADRFLGWGSAQPGANDAILKAGLALAQLGEHEAAIERFDELINGRSGQHLDHAIYAKAVSLRELGDLLGAGQQFRSVLNLEAADRFKPFAQRALGALALDAGKADEASEWFAQASESADADPSDTVNLAQALFSTGDPDAALDVLRGSSLRGADGRVRTQGRVIEALAKSQTGDHRGALRLIDSLLENETLDGATADRLAFERAVTLRELGEDDDAAQAFRSLQRSQQLGDRATLELAGIAIEENDYETAADALDALLANERDLPNDLRELATYRRGLVAHRAGDVTLAASLLDGFSERFPESNAAVSADLIAGRALAELGQHGRAAAHLQRVVDAEPPDEQLAPALLLLADARAQTQRFDDSLTAARAYLERYSDTDLWFRARFSEGWALENLGRYERAIEAYRLVAENHAGDTAARAQFQIGECIFAMGDHDAAVSELLKVDILHDSPEWSAAALYEAGRCFEALGKAGEARAQYRETIERFPASAWADPARERLSVITRAATPGRSGRGGF